MRWREYKWSIDRFIRWLEQHPPAKPYDYVVEEDCIITRFLRAEGQRFYAIGPETLLPRLGASCVDIPNEFAEIAEARPYTYGAALERARKIKDRAAT